MRPCTDSSLSRPFKQCATCICYRLKSLNCEILETHKCCAVATRTQFPLHFCLRAVAVNGGQNFILSLIEAYPEAASCKDSYGMTALHLACESGFSSVIVQRLYLVYPEAVMVQDEDGRTLLHLAFKSEYASLGVVKFLVGKYPEGAQSRSLFEELSLHYAVHHAQASVEVVQFSIETYPNAVNVTETDGMLSVHLACAANASLEVIQLLLDRLDGNEQYHNRLSIADNQGRLPFHFYACTQSKCKG